MAGERRICLTPRLSGVGGMVSFQHKLVEGLNRRGWQVTYDLNDRAYSAVLVIGGSRHLNALWRARRRGVRIVQRLDGMNWIHRTRRTGVRHFLRSEYGNRILVLIRSLLAHRIVYQSAFSQQWWEREYGPTSVPFSVVYNGVDLDRYTPVGPHRRPDDHYRLLLVEGSLIGGYEVGLETAVKLAQGVARRLAGSSPTGGVELTVLGRTTSDQREMWQEKLAQFTSLVRLDWAGLVPPERIPEIDRSAHLLYSADLNAACPNSVIEALACGLPVLAYDTGALPDMVGPDAGRIVPYGGDPWRLEQPDMDGLVAAALEILADQARYRAGARAQAEAAFDLDTMVDGYLQALLD